MISVSINGAVRHLATTITVSALLVQMQLDKQRIALERNGEIVPRSEFSQHMLADGDKLEIVVAVGGG